MRGLHDLDPLDPRGVEREGPLDADPVGDAPHREGRAGALAALADDDALEDLHPLLLALDDLHVHPHAVPGRESAPVPLERACLHHRDRIRRHVRLLGASLARLGVIRPVRVSSPLRVISSIHSRSSRVRRRGVQQIRPARQRAPERLAPPPPGDAPVVPGQQDVRHPPPPELRGPRVLRVVEPPARRTTPAPRPPGRRARPAGAAPPRPAPPAPAARRPSARSRRSRAPRRRAAPARARRRPRSARRAGPGAVSLASALRGRLRERRALRAEEHDAALRPAQGLHGGEEGLRLQHHAAAAAERVVVRDPVPALRVVSEIDDPDVDGAPLPGHAEHRLVERPPGASPGTA